MKIAIIADTHASIRNGADIFLENENKFYKDVFFPTVKEQGITQILHLGDYFDNRKTLNIKGIKNNRLNFLNVMRKNNMKMDIILGNHDVYYKNTNDVNALDEVLLEYDEINIIKDPTIKTYGNLDVALIPWINVENEETTMKFINDTDAPYCMGHFDIVGFELARGIPNKVGIEPKVFQKFKKVFSGHYHINQDMFNIEYIGCPYQLTWEDSELSKYFYILDTDTLEVQKIENPHKLFIKILYDDSETSYTDYECDYVKDKFVKLVAIRKHDPYMFTQFVDKLQASSPFDLKVNDLLVDVSGNTIDDEDVSVASIPELVSEYVDHIDTELDKDKIKKQINSIMIEAEAEDVA